MYCTGTSERRSGGAPEPLAKPKSEHRVRGDPPIGVNERDQCFFDQRLLHSGDVRRVSQSVLLERFLSGEAGLHAVVKSFEEISLPQRQSGNSLGKDRVVGVQHLLDRNVARLFPDFPARFQPHVPREVLYVSRMVFDRVGDVPGHRFGDGFAGIPEASDDEFDPVVSSDPLQVHHVAEAIKGTVLRAEESLHLALTAAEAI